MWRMPGVPALVTLSSQLPSVLAANNSQPKHFTRDLSFIKVSQEVEHCPSIGPIANG